MSDYYTPIHYEVMPEEEGWLFRTVLLTKIGLSRKLLTRLKKVECGLLINGVRKHMKTVVTVGDRIEVRMPVEQSEHILPQPIPFKIIYEDEHLLVVNKAAGLIVHPTHGHYTETLANGVVHYWQEKGEKYRFRPIHRLDQETSGVLAIAKNPYVHQHISEQMKMNEVLKEYVALVTGVMKSECGTIAVPIDRNPEDPHLRMVMAGGFPSVTHYEVKQRYERATQVHLRLETGRTHQIRVHLQHLGHSIIGDKVYGHAHPAIGRHALHAIRLGLIHPAHQKWMEFTAPWPPDLQNLEKHLICEGSELFPPQDLP